jgi:catalase (peroxidase I)
MANEEQKLSTGTQPPVSGGRHTGPTNAEWWPDQLNLRVLRQNSPLSDPMGKEFHYAKEFKRLDLEAVVKDLHALLTNSQDWWPADYGHYGLVHSYGLACRRYVPHRRRPRRGRPWLPTLCAHR